MRDPAPSKRLAGAAVLGDALVRELLGERLVGVFATLDPALSIRASSAGDALRARGGALPLVTTDPRR